MPYNSWLQSLVFRVIFWYKDNKVICSMTLEVVVPVLTKIIIPSYLPFGGGTPRWVTGGGRGTAALFSCHDCDSPRWLHACVCVCTQWSQYYRYCNYKMVRLWWTHPHGWRLGGQAGVWSGVVWWWWCGNMNRKYWRRRRAAARKVSDGAGN